MSKNLKSNLKNNIFLKILESVIYALIVIFFFYLILENDLYLKETKYKVSKTQEVNLKYDNFKTN